MATTEDVAGGSAGGIGPSRRKATAGPKVTPTSELPMEAWFAAYAVQVTGGLTVLAIPALWRWVKRKRAEKQTGKGCNPCPSCDR